MATKGSSTRGPSRRAAKPTAFEKEFPGGSQSANGVVIDLFRTFDAVIDLINTGTADLGLSATGRQALAVIEGAGEPLSPTTIAQRLFVTTASTTSLLDTLERRGFVKRMPDPTDRRKILVALTETGQQAVDDFLPKVIALQTAAMASLTEDERLQLRDALETIRRTAASIDTEAVTSSAPPRVKPKRA